jgi:cyclopropane-fatty-acyl-phospholipid synthase
MKNIEMLKDNSHEYSLTNKSSVKNTTSSSLYTKIILQRIQNAKYGQIQITLPNAQVITHIGKEHGQNVLIHFKSWKGIFQYALFGQLSFVEAYIKGNIDIPNLPALFNWFVDNETCFPEKQNSRFAGFLNRFSHLILRDNSRNGSRKNISFHYDLGNDFYKKWLDETMTYSSGLFNGSKTLRESQVEKYSRISYQLELTDGDRLLEIGCGWGGFAEHTLTNHDVNYRGITISNEQLEYAKERLNKISNKPNLTVFEDYRDTKGTFDKIVSIEMFEAVGEKHWESYFETIRERLSPGGKAVIQVITIDHNRFTKYRNRVDFIQKYIFPGGMLPSKQAFVEQTKNANLKIVNEFAFGQDYALTLRLWKINFIQNWSEIEHQGFDQNFYRLWLYYLDYCIAAFERNTIDVMHYTIAHDHE